MWKEQKIKAEMNHPSALKIAFEDMILLELRLIELFVDKAYLWAA